MLWRCPICAGDLSASAEGARCQLGHQFDRARQGYINLLAVNHKRSRDPGDSYEMIAARHAFLAAGHYQPLAAYLVTLLQDRLKIKEALRVLDCGCGEGYYTGALALGLAGLDSKSQVAGLDISRAALRLAARLYPEVQFAVGSNFSLPIQNQQIDVMIRNFAPGDPKEVLRVLRPQGLLILVSPGPGHLQTLKQSLYAEPRDHEAPAPPAGFDCVQEHLLRIQLTLRTQAEIDALLTMTPFLWTARRRTANNLSNLTHLATQAEFLIRCYQPAVV
jgi:23S rRNA (guanine745-N1)-methyltransferase